MGEYREKVRGGERIMEHIDGGTKQGIAGRKIVLLIGSTRFQDDFLEVAWKLTKEKGCVVLLPNFRPSTMMSKGFDIDEDILEDIGFTKIDFCDEVYVVNVDGYIGSSTAKEIEYAKFIEKPVYFVYENIEGEE